jgi:hypothetical protein
MRLSNSLWVRSRSCANCTVACRASGCQPRPQRFPLLVRITWIVRHILVPYILAKLLSKDDCTPAKASSLEFEDGVGGFLLSHSQTLLPASTSLCRAADPAALPIDQTPFPPLSPLAPKRFLETDWTLMSTPRALPLAPSRRSHSGYVRIHK